MKKLLIVTALAVMISLVLPLASFASPDMPRSLVDGADVLTDVQEDRIQNKLNSLVKKHNMHFVIVTVSDLDGRTPYSYADAYYHDNEYGYGKKKSGILLLLAMSSRDYYIYTYGKAENEFGDSELTDLEDAMLPHFGDDEFYDGFIAYIDACDEALSFDVLGSLMIAVVVGAIVSLIIVLSMKSKLKSVRPQRAASNYVRNGSFMLTKDLDLYLYRTVSRTRRANNSSSSSGGGSRGGGRGGQF